MSGLRNRIAATAVAWGFGEGTERLTKSTKRCPSASVIFGGVRLPSSSKACAGVSLRSVANAEWSVTPSSTNAETMSTVTKPPDDEKPSTRLVSSELVSSAKSSNVLTRRQQM